MPSNRLCRMSIMACGAWHVAPSYWNHMLSISSILGHKKLLIIDLALAVDGYGNARFVLEKVRTDESARPKSTSNSDFLGMHLELVYLAWIGIVSNSTILLVHISIHQKMDLIAKDDLFGKIWVNFQLLQNPISARRCLWSFTLSSWVS